MLQGDFYTVVEANQLENSNATIKIRLNAEHPIFKGHFPGNPIVPGVCLTQMLSELIEMMLKKSLTLLKADNIKFTAIVNPLVHPDIEFKATLKLLENNCFQADATFYSGEITFYKFKGSFKPQVA